MDPFDTPDLTILTNDGEAAMALWEMRNEAHDAGDASYDLSEKMEKAFTLERIHEIWIVVNDALQTGAVIGAIYASLSAVKGLGRKRLSIRVGARLRITRDDQDRLESLGCDLLFEKDEVQLSLPHDSEGDG